MFETFEPKGSGSAERLGERHARLEGDDLPLRAAREWDQVRLRVPAREAFDARRSGSREGGRSA